MPERRAALLAAALATLATPSGADEPSATTEREYSEYEQETIDNALEAVDGERDPDPEGKVIEEVEIVTLDVIEKRDPAPGFLNWFHATSRPGVVERELLLGQGDRYEQRRVDETSRNLRAIRQFSVVLIVPVKGSAPDRVKLLVVTKDIWSLRLNSNFRVTDGQLEFLLVQPSEENLLGAHHTVSTQFVYELDTMSFGGRFLDRRLGGHELVFLADANVIVNRESGEAEGSFGGFQYGKPLVSTETEWGWGTLVAWQSEITRRFVGLRQDTFDAESTALDDALPYEFDTDLLFWQTSVTRSYGRRDKTNLTFGLEANRRAFESRIPAGNDARVVREFEEEVLPTSDTRIGPFVQLDANSTRFHRVLDFNALGLQEDYQLGHQVVLKLYPAFETASSSRDMLGIFSGLAYTLPVGDGLARAYGSSTIELARDDAESDGQAEGGVRLVTPTLGFGRFVYDGGVLHRYRDYLNRQFALGGEGRLRGYFTRAFIGKDVVASNLEFRTRSIQLFTVQLGAAVFWDAGDAFDGFADMRLKHGAGIGLRGLFPQLDKVVGRLDVAFPLTQVSTLEAGGTSVVLTFGQAFPMPMVNPLLPNLSGSSR